MYHRRDSIIYLDTPNSSAPWTFNPFASVPRDLQPRAVAGLVEIFRRIWADDWGPRLEHLLRNLFFVLLEKPDGHLGDIPRLLSDKDYRRAVPSRISNSVVRDFWRNEFDRYSPGFRSMVVAPVQNKVGAFLSDPVLRRILTAEKSSFNLRRIMDERKTLLVNLSRGELGEGPSGLLGSLLLGYIGLAGLARASRPVSERPHFFVYVDECHVFATRSMELMLTELRKYHVGLTLANQFLSQLEPEVRDAILGNAGTLVCFRVGAMDGTRFTQEGWGRLRPVDLVNTPDRRMYLRLKTCQKVSSMFSAESLRDPASCLRPQSEELDELHAGDPTSIQDLLR